MNSIQSASRDLGFLVELVVKAMICIVIVYLVAVTLLPIVGITGIASKVCAALLDIVLVFVAGVSKRVRKEVMAFGHG